MKFEQLKPAALAATAAVDVVIAGYANTFGICRDVFEAAGEDGEARAAMRRISEDLNTLRYAMARIAREG